MIKVGIIGLGLIGSSILKKLAQNDKYELFCFSKSSYKKALDFCKNASDDIKIVSNCEIIFVCCEVSKTLSVLEELNEFLSEKSLVVDVASIKNGLLNKKFNYNFILSHPMAGTEKSGFDAGDGDLFLNCRWLIEKEDKILNEIIKDLGAIPFLIDMNKHDESLAYVSHLPTILSFLLFDNAPNFSKQFASSGFRDTTRLAMTNSNLALSMFNNNKENLLLAFNGLIEKMNDLKKMSDDEKISLLAQIAQKRATMYDNCGKNIFKI